MNPTEQSPSCHPQPQAPCASLEMQGLKRKREFEKAWIHCIWLGKKSGSTCNRSMGQRFTGTQQEPRDRRLVRFRTRIRSQSQRTSCAAVKYYIQGLGSRYFESSTEEQRDTEWCAKDYMCWGALQITRECDDIPLFKDNKSHVSFPMIEAGYTFLQYVIKDEYSGRRAGKRNHSARTRDRGGLPAPSRRG